MGIELNNGIITNAPQPADLKMYVGSNTTSFKYATKDDIPSTYLFEGLEVKDVDNDKWWTWKSGGWKETINSSTIIRNTTFDASSKASINHGMGKNVIDAFYFDADNWKQQLMLRNTDVNNVELSSTGLASDTKDVYLMF